MSSPVPESESRRELLRFLLGSPLAAGLGASLPLDVFAQSGPLAESLDDVLNVFDIQRIAEARFLPGHWAYMAQGADDSEMLEVNRSGFDRFQLRPRRLVDVSNIDTSVELFGTRYDIPIFLAPCGAQGAFHAEGEVAVGRAARSHNTLQILSTVTNFSVEDVARARRAPIWYQLYPISDWELTRDMLQRVEDAGCPALVLTVDIPARNLEQIARFRRDDNPVCQACHDPGTAAAFAKKPMFDGVDMSALRLGIGGLTWDYLDLLKSGTSMQVLVKGIVTGEDASRCIEHGADGIVVSNHGGRAEVSNRSSIECLPEVVEAVGGRVPVIVDSGFRRGTDVYKALALGASGVGIGRPYLWGLGSYGQEGVERVLELLTRELRIVMQQMGTPSIDAITRASIQHA
jgi:isopentenyl diphosphate isomerase/L-lactate dehydrogenase-like FMN-dependent dehydrogenase